MKPVPRKFRANALVAAAVATLAAGILAGCTSSGGTGTSSGTDAVGLPSGPITIGASLSLDGLRSVDGQAFKQGYQLWAADVNRAGGLLGHKVKLVILNDHSSVTDVVTNYQTLIAQDHVDLTFGPYSSLLTTPASAVAAKYGYAFVEGAGGAPAVFDTPLNQADHDVFDVSQPVADSMLPLVNYIKNLPADQRPKTAVYAYTADPFAAPPVQLAKTLLSSLTPAIADVTPQSGLNFVEPPPAANGAQGEGPATQAAKDIAALHPDLVVLGSTDVPMVQAFVQAFKAANYNPKLFVGASGPDQGKQFADAVGHSNTAGIMVPNGWFGSIGIPDSQKMVSEYIAQYGGTPADVNADVAEAYSVGEVMAQAVKATGGVSNTKIISYLHSGVQMQSVQGAVQFDALGENAKAVGFIFQWTTKGNFLQGLDTQGNPSMGFLYPKPNWGSG